MQIDLTVRPLADWAASRPPLTRGTTEVWLREQPIQEIGDPRIFGTRFLDAPLTGAPLVERFLALADAAPPNARGLGGNKIRDEAVWRLPEAQLLMLRALLLCCQSQQVQQAHVVDRWANVMQPGDFSSPHAHYDSLFAAVYFLDMGDRVDGDRLDGRLEIIDSRIPACCPARPEYPTRGIMPDPVDGTMLLFPASILHFVRPYHGGAAASDARLEPQPRPGAGDAAARCDAAASFEHHSGKLTWTGRSAASAQ